MFSRPTSIMATASPNYAQAFTFRSWSGTSSPYLTDQPNGQPPTHTAYAEVGAIIFRPRVSPPIDETHQREHDLVLGIDSLPARLCLRPHLGDSKLEPLVPERG